jgi:hypothetical protein
MTKPTDDLEAVRTIVEALEDFQTDDKERIIRWVLEKLKLSSVKLAQPQPSAAPVPQPGVAHSHTSLAPKDLRTFVAEKMPKNDVQFAATVAFYHRFEAPADQRKDSVEAEDLRQACRLANRERLKDPLQTLNNACKLGLLDRASRGAFTINSVGENLVAMTLPTSPGQPTRQAKGSKRTQKKAARRRK